MNEHISGLMYKHNMFFRQLFPLTRAGPDVRSGKNFEK